MAEKTDNLDQLPVTVLKGVGVRVAERLERLRMRTVQDVLFHLPLRYEDRTRVVPMGSLRPGQFAVVTGEVALAEVRFGRRRSLLVRISDGTGALTLRFFHFSGAQQAGFERGRQIRCYGEVRGSAGTPEMIHPEYRLLAAADELVVEEHLTPVYPATEGVHQLTLRSITGQALEFLGDCHASSAGRLADWLPPDLVSSFGISALQAALRYVHRPPPDASIAMLAAGRHPAQQRLAFEELLAHYLSLRRIRVRAERTAAVPFAGKHVLVDAFIEALPFRLTGSQQRVISDLQHDLSRPHPMARLVQGLSLIHISEPTRLC